MLLNYDVDVERSFYGSCRLNFFNKVFSQSIHVTPQIPSHVSHSFFHAKGSFPTLIQRGRLFLF